jgi:hypothetical protein
MNTLSAVDQDKQIEQKEPSPPPVVQDYYLVHVMGLPLSFIKHNAKKMGSFGRPRNYLYKNVVAYLELITQEAIEKSGSALKKKAANAAMVEDLFQEICALHDFQNNKKKQKGVQKKRMKVSNTDR